jgi:crossover junction endodeoxyribonuclease RuvC
LQLSKYDNHYQKLKLILTIELIDTHPDVAIEAPSLVKCAVDVKVDVRKVWLWCGTSRDIPITEYEPKKIKKMITGNGNATKEQVAKMLQQL